MGIDLRLSSVVKEGDEISKMEEKVTSRCPAFIKRYCIDCRNGF